MSTSVAMTVQEQRTNILAEVAEKYTAQIAAMAPKGMSPEHFIASLRLVLGQPDKHGNPSKLLECTPASIARGILRVAQTGLTLGESCDLLPFGKECQFNPRYNGIIELALAAGVRKISADVVREGDKFEYEYGTNARLHHVPLANNTKPITHAYALAEIKSGSYVFEVATREDIDAVRQRYSKQWKTGSLDSIPWYARKTMVRKLTPYLPKNPRLAAALQFSAEVEEGAEIEDGQFEVLPTEPAEPIEQLNASPAESFEAPAEIELKDEDGSALARAMATPLPGAPGAWSGQAGKPLGSMSSKHLMSISNWCVKQLKEKGENEGLQFIVDAIALILADREKHDPKATTPNVTKTPAPEMAGAAAGSNVDLPF